MVKLLDGTVSEIPLNDTFYVFSVPLCFGRLMRSPVPPLFFVCLVSFYFELFLFFSFFRPVIFSVECTDSRWKPYYFTGNMRLIFLAVHIDCGGETNAQQHHLVTLRCGHVMSHGVASSNWSLPLQPGPQAAPMPVDPSERASKCVQECVPGPRKERTTTIFSLCSFVLTRQPAYLTAQLFRSK